MYASGHMGLANIISALEGSDSSEASEVTYGLDGPQPEDVLVALRHNLESNDPDLVEITAMRLGVRFKDAESFQKIASLALTHPEELVVLAALKAMSAIPEQHPHLRSDAEATLQTVIQTSSGSYRQVEAAREYLRLVGQISTRQYASEDEVTILGRYQRRLGSLPFTMQGCMPQEIWFERIGWSYVPCHWKGMAVICGFAALGLASVGAFVFLAGALGEPRVEYLSILSFIGVLIGALRVAERHSRKPERH